MIERLLGRARQVLQHAVLDLVGHQLTAVLLQGLHRLGAQHHQLVGQDVEPRRRRFVRVLLQGQVIVGATKTEGAH